MKILFAGPSLYGQEFDATVAKLEQLNPERQKSTIDVARLMEFLKASP